MTQPVALERIVPSYQTLQSALFGQLEITNDDLIDFSDGLLGFPECHSWALLPGTKPGVTWLQSADHSALVFLLVDPFVFFEGYTAELSEGELRRLSARDATTIAVFAIVTLPIPGDTQCSANLQGPLVVNISERKGMQVVLGEGSFGVREPVPLDSLL